MNGTNALAWLRLILDLGTRIADAIHRKDYERVERILPVHLRTSIERQIGDDNAAQRFARQDEPTRPIIRDAGNGE